jgi:hypothetical protein
MLLKKYMRKVIANDFYYQLFLDLIYIYSHQQEFGNILEEDMLVTKGDDEK